MLLQISNSSIVEIMGTYLTFVKKAGSYIAKNEEEPTNILIGLQMELLPVDKYIEYISA